MSSQTDLPPASSPNLELVHPTEAECHQIWKGTHPLWGRALTLPTYLDRESRMFNGSLAFNGGQVPCILVDGTLPADQRPILSSCSTLRRPALVIAKDGSVSEGIQHGVASVFTFDEMRGRGYCKRMMQELGKELKSQGEKQQREALFSTLFSDIGKKFYHDVGWAPFESNHLQYPALSSEVANNESVKPLFWDDLPPLAERDEQLLRERLSPSPSKTRVALIPNLDALHWHMLCEEFMCSNIFNRKPVVRGAIYTPPGQPNSRIWATFTRNFYGGIANPEKNVVYILRFVIEDETVSDEVLAEGLKAIVEVAQKEAQEYLCSRVNMWNPSERVRKLGERIEGAEYVARESDSITSLQWFGDGSVDDIEWVANEKYGWC